MRIFDTFPFDGELDLLAFHLAEAFDLVDMFVVVEAAQTYRGEVKPLVFAANRMRFEWASSKIRHVALPSLGPGERPRGRAAVQRDAVALALTDADPDDIVLLLDVDEVPSQALLRRLRAEGLDEPRRLAMTRHYGFADTLAPRSPCCPTGTDPFPAAAPWLRPGPWDSPGACWFGHSGVAVPFRALAASSPFELRYGLPLGEPLPGAGRHFSSVDPSARPSRKLGRVFHEEYDGQRERSAAHLARCRLHGVHHRGWWYAERPEGPLPDDVARLIQAVPGTAMQADGAPIVRRLVRTWAWARLWGVLPDSLVDAVDGNFERWRAFLALPLLVADAVRAAWGGLLRLAGRKGPPAVHAH